jgi:hypothetical protein
MTSLCIRYSFRGVLVAAALIGLCPAVAQVVPTARPLLGTLVVEVPAGIIGTDYWVYVNKHIVSAPPHDDFASLNPVQITTPHGYDYFGPDGLIVSTEGNSYARFANEAESTLFQEVTVKVAPGSYVVEVLAKAGRREWTGSHVFPFLVKDSRYTVQVDPGGTATVKAVPPPGWGVSAAIGASAAETTLSDARAIAVRENDRFEGNAKAYYADPVVKVLVNTMIAFSSSPPFRPTVYVDLPETAGGPRELDAAQIDLIVDAAVEHFHYHLEADRIAALKREARGFDSFFDELAGRVEEFNKGIESLRTISEKLRRAGQGGG